MNEEMEKIRKGVEQIFDIRLYDYQLKFLWDCLYNDRVCARMVRQSGKSMTLAIYAILFACSNPKSNVLITAPTDEQASVIFNKVKSFFTHIQTNKAKILESDTQRSCRIVNGSQIKAMTTGTEALSVRGQTAHVLIIDESAFIKQSIYNEVLIPTILATKGKIIEISTPFGKSSHFYIHFQSDDWKKHHVPWKVAVEEGHLRQVDIDEARESLTKMQFDTEFEAEFVDDSASYFPFNLIQSCIEEYEMIHESDLV